MVWMVWFLFLSDPVVWHNAVIHTMDGQQTDARVIVTRDERIAFVGETVPQEFQRDHATWVDLHGHVVLPGLIDAHGHLASLGKSLDAVNLRGVSSVDEMIDKVVAFARERPEGTWILGRGWDQNLWPGARLPRHDALSAAVSQHPVCLYRVDGHACLINARAMTQCGLTDATPDPAGGRLVRHDGRLTGVLIDHAMELVDLPRPSVADVTGWLKRAQAHANRFGLTGIHDAGVDATMLAAYEQLAKNQELTLRSYLMIDGTDEAARNQLLEKGPQIGVYHGMLTIRSIKLLADGALGSRGAWLKEPYHDDPGNRGLQTLDADTFAQLLDQALAKGIQVNTHAIGDQANAFVLEQVHRAHQRAGLDADTRCRIEHAQIVDPTDIPKFRQYGILPSMQPTHCTSDMDWADERLGPDRLDGAYAWRSFRDLGLKIPMGSDFPVEQVNPFLGLYAAVTRQDQDGKPAGGFFPEQCLNRQEALLGFTAWAAYGAFQEDVLGSLEVGKFADFVVIDRDYFTVPVRQICEIGVIFTVVGGRVVYRSQ